MEGALSAALYPAWAVDQLASDEALARRACGEGVLRARRTHGLRDRGAGARRDGKHVGLHRPRLSAPGAALRALVRRRRRAAPPAASGPVSEVSMDFRDSPEEAEFRARLRAWIAEHNPGLPVSSTDDEYWARQAEWHTALYDAGFFGLSLALPLRRSRPALGLRRHPRRGARRRRRAAAPEPRIPRPGHHDARQRRDQGSLPSRPDQRPRALVPGLQRARRRIRPRRAAHHRDARRRRVRDPRPQDLDQLLRRRRLVLPARAHRSRRPEAQGALRLRGADAPARDRAAPAAHDQRHHQGVRPGGVRRRARPRRRT